MVRGDKGDVVTEYQAEQRHFVDSAGDESEPEGEHVQPGDVREGGGEGGVDKDGKKDADGDGINDIPFEFTDLDLGKVGTDVGTDGELREDDEFMRTGDVYPAGEMEGGAEDEGTEKVGHRDADATGDNVADARDGSKGGKLREGHIGDAGQTGEADIGPLQCFGAGKCHQQQGSGDEYGTVADEVEKRDNICSGGEFAGERYGLDLSAREGAEKCRHFVITADGAEEEESNAPGEDGYENHQCDGCAPAGELAEHVGREIATEKNTESEEEGEKDPFWDGKTRSQRCNKPAGEPDAQKTSHEVGSREMNLVRDPCGECGNAESCGKIENVRGQRSCAVHVYETHHLHVKGGRFTVIQSSRLKAFRFVSRSNSKGFMATCSRS